MRWLAGWLTCLVALIYGRVALLRCCFCLPFSLSLSPAFEDRLPIDTDARSLTKQDRMAAFQPTPTDISVIITSPSGSSNSGFLTERRITPTWSIMQLKSKLETMTGVPPSSQRLLLKTPGRPDQWIVDGDGSGAIGDWGLMKGCEIEVCMILFFFLFSFPLPGVARMD